MDGGDEVETAIQERWVGAATKSKEVLSLFIHFYDFTFYPGKWYLIPLAVVEVGEGGRKQQQAGIDDDEDGYGDDYGGY